MVWNYNCIFISYISIGAMWFWLFVSYFLIDSGASLPRKFCEGIERYSFKKRLYLIVQSSICPLSLSFINTVAVLQRYFVWYRSKVLSSLPPLERMFKGQTLCKWRRSDEVPQRSVITVLRGRDTRSYSKVEHSNWEQRLPCWEVGMWSAEDQLHIKVW